MSYEYSEDSLIENAAQEILDSLGWEVKYAWHKETFGENGLLGRENKSEVILKRYLLEALRELNQGVPENALHSAIEQLEQKVAHKSLGRINKEKYSLLKDGIQVSYTNDKEELEKKRLRVFNFQEPENNDFLAVRQLEIVGELYNRRADIIGFVNGIPLVFIELKAHHTDLKAAYDDNLNDYKDTIPHLFQCNAFIILSNGTESKVGTITSPFKFFHEWKRIEEHEEGVVSMDTTLRGLCEKNRLMDIFENFILFDDSGGEVAKILAKNHQYLGVNNVLENVRNIKELKGKLGVFWHTQGSGKSYSMVFICQKILRKLGGAYTFLMVLDRSELERQLYDTFTSVGAVTEKAVIAKNRENLKKLLQQNHRYVFTLIHKFSTDKGEDYPLITERENIIVLSDEAHRTQGGVFARNMRFNGIPNASYLGFTGTPIIKDEIELTKNIFGEYVSVYDFKRSIQDGATIPLLYINKGEKLGIENPKLDERMAEIINSEDLDEDQRRKLEREFAKDYPILTSNKRLNAIAKDLVWHFNERGYQGKAMLVTIDKPTAVRMYDMITDYWQSYIQDLENQIKNSDDQQEELELKRKLKRVKETEVCVVVSPEQNEVDKFNKKGLDIEQHRRKMVDRNLEKEFKDENNNFRLVIVCAMWITGFDVPSVSTIYLDKPIKGHTLMQTIARANRVFDDEKENGLIVDYGNVYRQLQKAYSVYGEGGRTSSSEKDDGGTDDSGMPVEEIKEKEEELKVAIKNVEDYLLELNFELNALLNTTTALDKLAKIKESVDCVCLNNKTRTQFEIMTRIVFRKFKALYPEAEVKKHLKKFNAIEAIYDSLNKKVKTADITAIMLDLQEEVDQSIFINPIKDDEDVYIDLSNLDIDKLKKAFEKLKRVNTVTMNLQKAIEKKLQQMMKQNPLRLEFYEKYKQIIEDYNNGKGRQAIEKAFDDLMEFLETLNEEDKRAIQLGLDEETLAIFDLLRKDDLTKKEVEAVKKVSIDTLSKLKEEKLKIDRWRESAQMRAQIRTMIYDTLQYLPPTPYPDNVLEEKTTMVYQHIYTNYPGGDLSTYGRMVS